MHIITAAETVTVGGGLTPDQGGALELGLAGAAFALGLVPLGLLATAAAYDCFEIGDQS